MPSRRASCSSSSRTASARAAACPGRDRRRRRMVLRLAGDRIVRNDDAVDADTTLRGACGSDAS